MEQTEDFISMLDLLIQPAFCVRDGIIHKVNYAAEQCLITAGTPVADLLSTGKQEYLDYSGGCLYLTVSLSGETWGASITRMNDWDIFLLEKEESKADLQAMALAAQELRQPLSSVMAITDQLFPMVGSDDNPVVCEQMSRINRNLFQLLRMVSNMSDAYLYAQDSVLHQETRDICSILEEVFEKCASMVEHAGITLHFTCPKESIYCLVDAEKLERAVNNIISNAIKYSSKGGRIDALLKRSGKMLYLTVQDNGSSVDKKLQRNVFARFRRTPGLEDSRYGIGLGMVLIRSVATQHGGTVLMEYPKDGGTRLTMTMAIRQNKNAMVRSPALKVDYAGERDHQLVELSDSLPASLYGHRSVN